MNRSRILPDTCAWIDFFKGTPSALARLLDEALRGDAAVFVCGPVIYELIQGVRSEKEETILLSAVEGLERPEMTETTWVRAGRLSASLRKKGVTLPYSDILIAAIALENDLTILTVDKHFAQIPDLKTTGLTP